MSWLKEEVEVKRIDADSWQKVTWRSPSNIALVKYWGKKGMQLPMNPSLSFSLTESFTETTVFYKKKFQENNNIEFEYFFEGNQNINFSKRIDGFLQSIIVEFPFLNEFEFRIESRNSFPHSAGIASSASSMSALALCLCSIEQQQKENKPVKEEFFKKASFFSRLGSGSASRSVYGGFSIWGHHNKFKGSSDLYAVPVKENVHSMFANLQDSILIIDKGQKNISSSKGHQLMEKHQQRELRKRQANKHFSEIIDVLGFGDFEQFTTIVELEALAIHQLMESSIPAFTLTKPATYNVIDKLKAFRNTTNLPVCFTLDAGPNIHLIYPLEIRKEIINFIETELQEFCSNNFWIDDRMGMGPVRL